VAVARPVEERPDRGEQRRQQRRGHQDRDQRDEQAAVAYAAQEGQGQHDEGQQADADRRPAEDDRAAGRGHGAPHRLIIGVAAGALLAPTRDDQQRVVDGDAQAD